MKGEQKEKGKKLSRARGVLNGFPLWVSSGSLLSRADQEACGLEVLVPSWFEHRLLVTTLMAYFFEVSSFSVITVERLKNDSPNIQGQVVWFVPSSLVLFASVLLYI